jgi:AraC-like DNA-binding protein
MDDLPHCTGLLSSTPRRASLPPPSLNSPVLDQLYYFGAEGFIYASPRIATPRTERHPAVLLLSADGRDFRLGHPDRIRACSAAAVAPLSTRALDARGIPLISLHIQPRHPAFGAFRGIGTAGIRQLKRHRFSCLDSSLQKLCSGSLDLKAARELFDAAIECALPQLPPYTPDPHLLDLLEQIERNPDCPLSILAKQLGMSYSGASHLFSRAIGIPFRSYRLWHRAWRAWETMRVDGRVSKAADETGFYDAAHLSHEWKRWYGMPMSMLLDRTQVNIVDEMTARH